MIRQSAALAPPATIRTRTSSSLTMGILDVLERQDICRAVAVENDGFHDVSPSPRGYWNTSSSGTSKTRATWNAISSEGE